MSLFLSGFHSKYTYLSLVHFVSLSLINDKSSFTIHPDTFFSPPHPFPHLSPLPLLIITFLFFQSSSFFSYPPDPHPSPLPLSLILPLSPSLSSSTFPHSPPLPLPSSS